MKTKNILYKLACIAGIVFLISGCSDFLTRDAEHQTTEDEWWVSKEMLQTVLEQLYRPMPGGTLVYTARDISQTTGSMAYYNMKVENEGLTDNGVTCANYVDNTSLTYGTASSSMTSITNIWNMKWAVIRRCCRYLENYHKAVFDPDKQPHEGIQSVDMWAAEARALRAYYHLELFTLFGPIPVVDHVLTPTEQKLERKSQEEVISWIVTELEEASKNLPVKPQVPEERWRWTKGACYAYISYLYMFVSDWENAKAWAQKVIDLNIYDLYRSPADPEHSYSEQFLYEAYTNNTPESILTKDKGAGQATWRLLPPGYRNGGTGVAPTASMLDAYELKDGRTLDELSEDERRHYHIYPTPEDRDPRLGMTICFPNEEFLGYSNQVWSSESLDYIGKRNSSKTGYWIKKWVNEQDLTLSDLSTGTLPFQLMRYAVVLLNYVECAIELGELGDPKIYEYLDMIRDRAGMPPVDRSKYATQEKLRELVRRERRVELAFEGHRLMDIRRWKIGEEVMNCSVYGAKMPDSEELFFVEERRFNPERDYLWPIPLTEITSNEKMVQNPGY